MRHPFDQGWSAGVEYAQKATVAEIVEWLRTREADDTLAVSYGQTTYYDNGVRAAAEIEARFAPGPEETSCAWSIVCIYPDGCRHTARCVDAGGCPVTPDEMLGNLPGSPPEREDAP